MLILMRWAGITRLFQFFHRKHIVVLMIHGVMDDQDNLSWRPLRPFLSRQKLDEYLMVLSRRYHFISLMDAVEILQQRQPIQPYSMVLTFDDGYRNNLTHALPILRRYDAPATFFVSTGFLGNPRPFWFDRLDYAVQHAQVDNRELRVGSCAMRLDCSSRKAFRESFISFIRTAQKEKMSDSEFVHEVERLAAELEAESGRALSGIHKEDAWTAMMSWDQIERLDFDDVTFASHTVDHVRLGQVDVGIARNQLKRAKQDIEQHTGMPCQIMSYPNGSFNKEVVKAVRECGYVCGLTSKEGLNKAGDDLMTLRRIGLGINWSNTDLLARVSGVSTTLSRVVKLFRYNGSKLSLSANIE